MGDDFVKIYTSMVESVSLSGAVGYVFQVEKKSEDSSKGVLFSDVNFWLGKG